MSFPPGGGGKRPGRNVAGWAAATAVRNRVSRNARCAAAMARYRRFFRPMASGCRADYVQVSTRRIRMMDDKTRTELEAAVYRRLVEHLRSRTDVQNIDMMNLAGFCRN